MIVLDPAVITGTATVTGEAVTSYQIYAYSPASGLSAEQTFTAGSYSLTVDDGQGYRPRAWFYFNHPGTSSSRLQVQRNNEVSVNADVGPTTVNFSYEARRVTAPLQITGESFVVMSCAGMPARLRKPTLQKPTRHRLLARPPPR